MSSENKQDHRYSFGENTSKLLWNHSLSFEVLRNSKSFPGKYILISTVFYDLYLLDHLINSITTCSHLIFSFHFLTISIQSWINTLISKFLICTYIPKLLHMSHRSLIMFYICPIISKLKSFDFYERTFVLRG